MEIKYPRIKLAWNNRDIDAAHEVVRMYIRLAVYISPLALWKLYDLLGQFTG